MINVFMPYNNLGFGIHAKNMTKALIENGEDITISEIGQRQKDPYFNKYLESGIKNIKKFNSDNPSLFIFHDQFSHQASGSPLMTFSIFETDKIRDINKNMLSNGPTDIVLATTKDHANILKDNGISKPIKVVNEGVDESLYNTIPYDPIIETNKFTYITVGKREDRKNTDVVLESWMNTMKDKEVALISHTFNPFLNNSKEHPFTNLLCWCGTNPINFGFDYKGFNGQYHKFTHEKCDIYFTAPTIETSRMPSLYHSANVGILFSKGEAWSLPTTEMLACGVPVIASNCIGHREYIHGLGSIQDELICSASSKEIANDGVWFNGEVGNWDAFDKDELIDKIKYTYNNREKYEEKNDEISDNITEKYSWKKSVESLSKVINDEV